MHDCCSKISTKNVPPLFIVFLPDKAIKAFRKLTPYEVLTQLHNALRQLQIPLFTCIMCAFHKKLRFIVIVTAAVLTVALSKNMVEGERQHFYARQSKDLRQLAHVDFELMLKLKSLESNLTHEQKSSQSLLSSAVEM